MENFTNEPIDITNLPRYETVNLNALQPKYWNVILLNITAIFLIIGIALAVIVYFVEEIHSLAWLFGLVYVLFLGFTFFLCRISFHKRGFAFREHDVIYRSGILATNTMIIPYNRVQHVALHEGFISRYFDLAKVEIFTAGGDSSDVSIPGIKNEQAEDIKQLLMGKIQKQL
ncbi:MAG: PH domain-containing protein [Flavobacterium sp.]|jgi:membrane protein YdbS with pleckstrin-like domain|uniref:PH domain-containing protein n=1 Tax=Flavobacterium TaxID=237 RepID=UPI0022C5285A|nr:PH domain-containing protein [Flavobacterium sp.]MCZ8332116.1 PH domain-containing protein [Flavobacterium sp.]